MMLGARTAAWAKLGGGVPTAKDYVQDGLIAMWDGIENAGLGVHDPNATVWKDLIGNGDLTVTGGAFGVDACNGRAENSVFSGFADAINQNSVTIEFVASGANAQSALYIMGSGNLNRLYSGDGVALKWLWTKGGLNNTSAYMAQDGSAFSISCGIGGTSTSDRGIYYNGVHKSSGNAVMSSVQSNGIVTYRGLDKHCVRIYNRALTAAEVAANYAVDKARFNLQ